MAIPLIALVPIVVTWARNALAAGGLIALVSQNSVSELLQMVVNKIIAEVAKNTGLVLDPDDPFTDASIAGAISEKIGITIRSVKDQTKIKEDINNYVVQLLSEKSGYQIHSVTDSAVLKEDFLRIGTAQLSQKLGLPAGTMPGDGEDFSPMMVRLRLLAWAKAENAAGVSGDITQIVAEISAMPNVVATAGALNSKLNDVESEMRVTARQIAVKVADQLAVEAITTYQQYAGYGAKLSRKRALQREASRKFRSVHGNRQQYMPIGGG